MVREYHYDDLTDDQKEQVDDLFSSLIGGDPHQYSYALGIDGSVLSPRHKLTQRNAAKLKDEAAQGRPLQTQVPEA